MKWLILLGVTQSVFAAAVECKARVALNRYYSVAVDRQTRQMKIVSDGGATWEGLGSYYLGSREEAYYFPLYVPYENTTYYPSGMALRIDRTDNKLLLCLRTAECYICR